MESWLNQNVEEWMEVDWDRFTNNPITGTLHLNDTINCTGVWLVLMSSLLFIPLVRTTIKWISHQYLNASTGPILITSIVHIKLTSTSTIWSLINYWSCSPSKETSSLFVNALKVKLLNRAPTRLFVLHSCNTTYHPWYATIFNNVKQVLLVV